jgi:iron complex outermembrane recepter protein
MKNFTLLLCSFLLACSAVHAQNSSVDSVSALLSLPLEKLMDIPIYSASKEEESSFDAPLSSSVITKEQIQKAGSTTIMEAMRLLPGVIVREQTNGSYDIHILGLDNVPPNSSVIFFSNSTTLVMIDNRPVYNYLHGGTFWETLPITLNDVERIELVRGPCAPMFGPNAVSGVINIITRKPEKSGTYAIAEAEYGSYNTLITQASLGYKFSKKVSAWVSGNYQKRNRTQTTYYDVAQDKYVPIDSVLAVRRALQADPNTINESFSDPRMAMNKYGYNGFVNYDPEDRVHFGLALGGQDSRVQNEFAGNLTPINTTTSATQYGDLIANIYDFNLQASYLTGTQSPSLGQKIWKWDFNSTDVTAEYNFHKIRNLDLRPGLAYRLANYNDSRYIDVSKNEGLWSGNAKSETKAVSLRADYHAMDNKLRIVAAGRLDNFNFPTKSYLSYQFDATYKLNENNLVRASEAKSYRTPLLIDLYTNLNETGPLPLTNPNQVFLLQIRGNQQIRLLSSQTETVGYRSKLNHHAAIDIQAYYSRTKDFSDVVFESGAFDSTGPVSFTGLVDINNLTVHTRQFGVTIAFDYIVDKWQIKPFVTFQKTSLLDYSPYGNSPNAPALPSNNSNPAVYNIYSNAGTTINHLATPSYFGGFYINWAASSKVNCNVNGYFFGESTELEASNLTYHDGSRGVQHVPATVLLNAVVSYKIAAGFTVFGNVRNILDQRQVEFYKGDSPAFMAFAGLNFEL